MDSFRFTSFTKNSRKSVQSNNTETNNYPHPTPKTEVAYIKLINIKNYIVNKPAKS